MQETATQSHVIARATVMLLAGLIFGYLMVESSASDQSIIDNLTREEYVANYETHIAELRAGMLSPVATYLIGLILSVGIFGIYEAMCLAVTRVVGHFAGPWSPQKEWPSNHS